MRPSVIRDQGPTIHQDDFIWTSCTCNNLISKLDHILRHWRVRMSTYGFGGGRGHNSTLSNTQGATDRGPASRQSSRPILASAWASGKVPCAKEAGVPLAPLLALGLSCGTYAAAMALARWAAVAARGTFVLPLPAASLSSPLCLADLLANLLLVFVLCFCLQNRLQASKCMLVCLQCPCNCLIGALGK